MRYDAHWSERLSGTESRSRLETIRHVVATIFSAQNALRSLAPEFKWRGVGNLLGD